MAYEIGYDIVVDDENCNYIKEEFDNISLAFEARINEYLGSLERAKDGLKEGEAADNLKVFVETAKTLENEILSIKSSAVECIKNFLTDIDDADSYLY